MPHVGGKCLVFDGYGRFSDDLADRFGLLAVIEVFRSEMEFARANTTAELITRLNAAGATRIRTRTANRSHDNYGAGRIATASASV